MLSEYLGVQLEKNKVRYTKYYGDGDAEAFSAVANDYGDEDKVKKKQECIGHIQKRVGSRLRKLKKNVHGLGKLGLRWYTGEKTKISIF